MIIRDNVGYSGVTVVVSRDDFNFLRSLVKHLGLINVNTHRLLSVSALCELIVRDECNKLRLDFPNLCDPGDSK